MTTPDRDSPPPPPPAEPAIAPLAVRGVFGGAMMGLANLVPGISGGTMLLAAGVYPRFIEAVSDVTRLRFRPRSLLVLGLVAGAAVTAIALLAGVVKNLVVDHRWVMFSLFIGLTLGGAPVVWGLIRRPTGAVWAGAAAGFAVMALVALAQLRGASGAGQAESGFLALMIGGIAAASAMILPGVSGGYLLLVLGQYVPILAAVDELKEAVRARDLAAAWGPAISVCLPVGLGVIIGVAGVSNLLRWVLARFEKATLGVLLGLLLGAVVGLWPFQQGVPPQVGDVIKGVTLTEATVSEVSPDDYPVAFFAPTPGQIAGAAGLIVLGFVATVLIARVAAEAPVASAKRNDNTNNSGTTP